MTVSAGSDLYYDPYDVEIFADPYPVFRRLREEAPLYYNERYDFHALSRFDDCEAALRDHGLYSSARGDVLEAIKSGFPIPDGFFIMEDPPLHTVHRGLLSRVFTPRRVSQLESQIRDYCREILDPLVGSDRFDFVADLGARMPMQVIGMLLGIPEEDQEAIRRQGNTRLHRDPGKPADYSAGRFDDEGYFGQYLDWRMDNPSDDLMTALVHAEFEDEKGEVRRLTRKEILTYVYLLASAGNETTNRLIGWIGKLLGDHPDQRRRLVAERDLVPSAVEEVLRFESPAVNQCRTVTRDVELHGRTVEAGSVMMLLVASANRDHRAFPPDGDVFDVGRRSRHHHLTFGYGIHFCLGAALARMEGRIALEEVLDRFPDWEIDPEGAQLDSSVVRGWASVPVSVG